MRDLQFPKWLSRVWTGVISPVDPDERSKHLLAGTDIDFPKGLFASSPQSITMYFLKHSLNSSASKEYQNVPPAEWRSNVTGPGRFWGIWGLKDVSLEIELSAADWIFVSRTLRRYVRARKIIRRRRVIRRSLDFVLSRDYARDRARVSLWIVCG